MGINPQPSLPFDQPSSPGKELGEIRVGSTVPPTANGLPQPRSLLVCS